VPRTPASDTAARIRTAALDLFATQGFEKTSLQQIADRLGLTKPALYYHFPSKEALIRSLVQPLVDDLGSLLAQAEKEAVPPRRLLEALFDVTYRHRVILLALSRELKAIREVGMVESIWDWRLRVHHLLAGPDAPVDAQVRATVALGGLQDSVVLFPDTPPEVLRPAAVDAACAALGRG
jgi:AcrR family transcriptional regulator